MLDAITELVMSTKPVSYNPQSPRLLNQLREFLRYKHYSLRTEDAYQYRVKLVVRWHTRNGQMRLPRDATRECWDLAQTRGRKWISSPGQVESIPVS